jgi:hypothetical protein
LIVSAGALPIGVGVGEQEDGSLLRASYLTGSVIDADGGRAAT